MASTKPKAPAPPAPPVPTTATVPATAAPSNFPGYHPGVPYRLYLPSAIAERYETEAREAGLPVETLLQQAAQRMAGIPHRERVLVIRAGDREALETALAHPLKDTEALVQRVEALSRLSVAGVTLRLEPWQMEEIRRRAAKNGIGIEEELRRSLTVIQGLIFSSVPV